MRCPRCLETLVPAARFCHQCGFEAGAAAADAGELRQLTVMFADLVDSTRLSERLDPEDLREVIRSYQSAVGEVVERFDGTVAQYLGDGVLVYFGYPRAHEDDACRAVRAGLAILARLETLNTEIEREHGVRVALRLAAHTGPVVVGAIGAEGRPERIAVGKTVNVAARIATAADPGCLVISDETRRLAEPWMECRNLGEVSLKGVSEPVATFQVVGERAGAPGASGGLVGRSREVAVLEACWRRVRADGSGRIVVLHGEPGIGKTRLVQVLRARVREEQGIWLEGRCSELHAATVLYPVADLLEEALGLRTLGAPAQRRQRLEEALAPYRSDRPDPVALVASLLGLPEEVSPEPLEATPQRRRFELIEALTSLVRGLARRRPVALVLEDVHWIDPTTLQLLDRLASRIDSVPVLLLVTHRPGAAPTWSRPGEVQSLALTRLPADEVARLVRGLPGGSGLPPQVVESIVAKADGVPLFAEELAKMMLESDLETPPGIPMTLRDSLMARLDRIPRGKEIAQIAASIGRTFSVDLLCRVTGRDEGEIRAGLEPLLHAGLVEAVDEPPQGRFAFKHALIQEASYRSLLRRQRRAHHQRIAQALLAGEPETVAIRPEVVAHHLSEAGSTREAVAWWQRAGQRALEKSAADEASSHLRRGLAIARELDGAAEQEVAMQTSLGTALAMREGYASAAVEEAFSRARELAEASGDPGQLFGVLRGLAGFYKVRAEHDAGLEVGRRLADVADRLAAPALAMEAAWVLGSVELFQGRLLDAVCHLERALAIYEPALHRGHASLFGEEPGAAAHLHLAAAHWLLGRPEQARRSVARGLALADASRHANTTAFAYSLACHVYQHMGDVVNVERCGHVAMRVAREQGFPLWCALSRMYLGWTLARGGKVAEGILEIRSGFEDWRDTGARLGLPFQHAILAEELRRGGRACEALELVERAIQVARTTGERFFEPELLRLRAELLVEERKGDRAEAEASFEEALALAGAQAARALELRAATSRVRTLGATPAALERLALCAGRFAEGCDLPELAEARRLLRGATT